MLRPVKSDIYYLLHPKIAFFLTSISKKGKPNVMACAWATPVSEEPPIVVVCVSKEAYTSSLIKESKEFVINIPSKVLLRELWICGKTSGRDTDKFKRTGLKIKKARKVKSPVIAGCVGYIECRLQKTVEAGECYAFFGKVVSAYADHDYLDNGLWKEDARVPLHLGGSKIVYAKKK